MPDYLAKYVKFQRGTPTAYGALANKDEDTLYFVGLKDAITWDLYLGEKHVGTSSGSTSGATKLGDLTDIDLTGAIDGSLLGYNKDTGKWGPVDKSSLGTAAQVFQVTPNEGETESEAILRVVGTSSNIGDLILVSINNKINTWVHSNTVDGAPTFTKLTQEINSSNIVFEDNISSGDGVVLETKDKNLTEVVSLLVDKINDNTIDAYTKTETDTKIGEAVAKAGHIQRKIVNSLEEIDLSATDADQFIYLVPNNTIGDNKYDEYIIIDGALEKVGDWAVDLSDYVKKDGDKVLSTNDYTNEDKTKVQESEKNVINSVDTNEFEIVTGQVGELNLDRQLQIKSIDVAKIGNLTDQVVKIIKGEVGDLDLYNRLEKVETSINLGVDSDSQPILVSAKIGTLETLITNNTEKINELDARLTWSEIAESSTT